VLVAVSNFELPPEQESHVSSYSPDSWAAPRRLSAGKSNIGPMAVADIDGDGDLDLFVGARFLPGRYPEAVSSAIWLNEVGELRPSVSASKPFASVGLVSGATFSDLDGDGLPDLALAVEWSSPKLFHNDHGRFRPWDWPTKTLSAQPSTLSQLTGWWTSIASGDFDGDGRLDLAVGNWGRNSQYELYRDTGPTKGEVPSARLRLWYDDWSADGTIEMIEAWQRDGDWFPARSKLWLASGSPELASQFPTHQAFGQATIREILGPRLERSKVLEVTELASGILLNRGSRFDWMPLPREAQLAPVFSMNVGDFDGDGVEDLFLSQNFFGTVSDLARDDAGRGLWLRGQGDGTFVAADATLTGIQVFGEQRGAALADFNHDGRVDVVVAQNNAATRLFLNRRARPGLRVVLDGPTANPDAVGARLRVQYAGGRAGPVREVQAGSGYWSQNGAAQVLGLEASPVAVWVRWPGAREQTVPVPEQPKELRLNFRR
jgi:hypothetical protein